jgi:hypothetical protein
VREDAQEIGSRLSQALEEAKREHAKASQTFEAIREDVPSGSPHTDLNHLVEQAARESRAALEAYRHAFQRYTNFTLRGIIPEDLDR